MTYLEAIADAMRHEMRRDESVFMIGEDIGTYGGAFKVTKGFLDEFGAKRIIDAPISEAAIIGSAIGASLNGMRPIVEMQFMDFITNGFNQVVTVAGTTAYRWGLPVPMVVRGPSGGGVGGNPFHSRNSEAWFAHATGLKVVCPAFPDDAKGLMIASIRDNDPVMFFEHKALYRSIDEDILDGYYTIPFGKARLVKEGADVTIVTYGLGVHWALELLNAHPEISADLIDLRTLAPLDTQAIYDSVKKTGKAFVLHEDTLTGGIGGELSALITEHCFEYLDAPVMREGSLDTPVPMNADLEINFLPKERFKEKLMKLINY